ncbi:class I SAM-dependent methyltransferase [Frankia sp. Cppng1_Ct_nod]|uniref:THUMP-like domain-containing protein n=1 Tax=Frankia sp. Cppng1_Ct_nod TaxID=2897162 RepID=UPI0020254E51|nr:class I SAM-dependent methyltransferase [Frankia sp. Cppng1_Ct_nod]
MPAGQDLLEAATGALASGAELALGARLRAAGHPPELVAAAFTQAELRARAAAKFSRAAEMFFTRDGLEQASSEAAARHRATRFQSLGRLADLCTGIGGDLLALTATHDVLAVDRDPTHLRMACHNAGVHNAGVHGAADRNAGDVDGRCDDVQNVDLGGVHGVFVDPARRTGAGRLAAGACTPPLAWCFGLTDTVAAVVVKAAPGLPLHLVPPGWEVEFVADRRDLKEAVLFSPALATVRRRASVLLGGLPGTVATLTGDPDLGPLPVGEPAGYLYDPSPAVTRAGLVGELGRGLDARQIDPRIAFLTCDGSRPTPFARVLRVEHSLPFDVRSLARLLRTAGVGAVDVRRRGLAGDVEVIRRRLLPRGRDLVPGGPAVTVVMTRHAERPWALVCTDPTGVSLP